MIVWVTQLTFISIAACENTSFFREEERVISSKGNIDDFSIFQSTSKHWLVDVFWSMRELEVRSFSA
jgi:hypothetical protein